MTSVYSDPCRRVAALLEKYGYTDGFTIDETGTAYGAPIVQSSYPNETASDVADSDSIIGIQMLGGNTNTFYSQDLNVRLHLWTPTNGSQVWPFYKARMVEIINGLKTNYSDTNIHVTTSSPSEDGEMDSGRRVFSALVRVQIVDLD